MALSYCTDWGPTDPLMPEMGLLHHHHHHQQRQQQELDLIDLPFSFNDEVLLKEINEFFAMDAEAPEVLPPTDDRYFASFSDPSVLSLPHDPHHSPDTFDVDATSYQHQSCTKRSRSVDGLFQFQYSSDLVTNVDPFHHNIHGFNRATPSYLVPPPLSMVEYHAGHNYGTEKKMMGNGGVSPQSVAARERRKRISDKTQVLGRLVPGGTKMSTAEMFEAAANYVKFLQAQVGMLGLMAPKPSQEGVRLHRLLSSPSVQERLSRAQRCIVPKWMVEDLAKDRAVRSHPSISRDLDQFVRGSGAAVDECCRSL